MTVDQYAGILVTLVLFGRAVVARWRKDGQAAATTGAPAMPPPPVLPPTYDVAMRDTYDLMASRLRAMSADLRDLQAHLDTTEEQLRDVWRWQAAARVWYEVQQRAVAVEPGGPGRIQKRMGRVRWPNSFHVGEDGSVEEDGPQDSPAVQAAHAAGQHAPEERAPPSPPAGIDTAAEEYQGEEPDV